MPDDESNLYICPDCQEKINSPEVEKMVEETADLFFRHMDANNIDWRTALVAAAKISSSMADEILARKIKRDPGFTDVQVDEASGVYVEMIDFLLGDITELSGDFDDDDDGYDDEDAAPSMH